MSKPVPPDRGFSWEKKELNTHIIIWDYKEFYSLNKALWVTMISMDQFSNFMWAILEIDVLYSCSLITIKRTCMNYSLYSVTWLKQKDSQSMPHDLN